jgi:Phage major capsid protein E
MPQNTTFPEEALYRSSVLIESVRSIPPAPVHLRDRLFSKSFLSETDLVNVSTYKAKQKLSPFVSRYSKGTSVPREVGKLSTFSPPFAKPIRNLSADDLFFKGQSNAAGYSGETSQTDVDLLASDFLELDTMISRAEEKMVSDVLFSGTIVCRDGDTNEIVATIAYGTVSTTAPAALWTVGTSKPLDDLKACQRLVSGACGYTADVIVMSKEAADLFESNTSVLDAYNKMFIQQGSIEAKYTSWGIINLGTFRGVPLTVDETVYEDSAGALKTYVPPGYVLVAASALQGTMCYGGVPLVSDDERRMNVVAGKRIPTVVREAMEDFRKLRVSSRPLPVPADLSSWTIMKVIP